MSYNPVNPVNPVNVVSGLPQFGHPPMIPDAISHYTILDNLDARVAEPVLGLVPASEPGSFQGSNSAYAGLGRGSHGFHNRRTFP